MPIQTGADSLMWTKCMMLLVLKVTLKAAEALASDKYLEYQKNLPLGITFTLDCKE